MLNWKLKEIIKKKNIHRTALAEVLIQAGEIKASNREHGQKIVSQWVHRFPRVQDPIRVYRILKDYLDVSPEELTGLPTDREAILYILAAKYGFEVEVEAKEIPEEVKSKYMTKVRKRLSDQIPEL
jgi:hypothetical protein